MTSPCTLIRMRKPIIPCKRRSPNTGFKQGFKLLVDILQLVFDQRPRKISSWPSILPLLIRSS
jgi:hypothetical protein